MRLLSEFNYKNYYYFSLFLLLSFIESKWILCYNLLKTCYISFLMARRSIKYFKLKKVSVNEILLRILN